MEIPPDLIKEVGEHKQFAINCLQQEEDCALKFFSQCESPIELAFAAALWSVVESGHGGGFSDIKGQRCVTCFSFGDPFKLGQSLFVTNQHALKIGDENRSIRADFYFRLWTTVSMLSPKYQEVDIANVIVELDGHDFHERTKEQARRDRSRDRMLVQDGFTVFRFTGQEVYEDAEKCVWEVIRFIVQMQAKFADDHGLKFYPE